ncbi:MAG TPA: hypothetical protein VI282_20485 [Verrucomicrobiae bacterium]|jgi:hypothetical protein
MKNWKTMSSVVLVFVLGMLVGIVGTHRFYQKRLREFTAGPIPLRQAMLRGLAWRLHLTAEQRVETDNAIRDAQRQFQEIRKEVQPQVEEILQRAEERIRAQLDVKQREKFDRLIEEHRNRWRKSQVE